MKWMKSRLTHRIFVSIRSGLPGQGDSMSIKPILLYASPICLPGVVVECQDERSQHKNRARAMAVLKSRLLEAQIQQQQREQASTRKSLVGSGDRSERIRTYNFPQGRITDHRINLTLYKLDEVLKGRVDLVIVPLISEHQAHLLADLNQA